MSQAGLSGSNQGICCGNLRILATRDLRTGIGPRRKMSLKTTRDLLERLSRKALDDYNQESRTQFEFVKVVKANFHFCCAIMFLITFEVVDPYDNLIKLFQTRVRHAEDIVTEYVFCRPKPNQGVECIGVKNNDGKDVQTNVKEQEIGVGASICHKE
ncbi:unnamed protein product [Arabidopsis thaliana]|uniref:Uncharacterized protein n=1 Tax=Arabidopsis thaliana TaxID=3702 RepID=A0A5S9WRM9_ARATH|nr:unnamed protein product [Arabidopsis thaliana]